MTKVRYSILFILLFTFLAELEAQQYSQFSLYNQGLILINPAYAGSDGALNLSLFHRSQWSGLKGAPETQAFLAHMPFKSNMGLGFGVYNDKIGVHSNLRFNGSYAYRIEKDKNNFLSFGLNLGINNRSSNYSSIANQVSQSNDPKIQGGDVSGSVMEFGAGVLFKKQNLTLGYSALNLLPSEFQRSDSLVTRFDQTNHFVYGQYKINVHPLFHLQPTFLLKYTNNLQASYEIGMSAWYNHVIMAGVSYRKKESVAANLMIQISPQLRLGYAYDIVVGDVSGLGSGSHELMVNYIFIFNKAISSPR